MKILKLRFKNLNSLEGEWCVDFTDETYTSNGIFAITGPTGAGKTTILDAVTLALYASTPRLGKITGSFNEVMSRKAGECFSEVKFETTEGIFTSHFSQHRSKRSPGGKLQPPKHEISDHEGKIVSTGLSRVPNVVKEITGMDFERFTKSILLAQGGFAAFLEASPGDRAPILEEITGTEIYSEISMEVHEKKAGESIILEKLESYISGISILESDEEDKLGAELMELREAEKKEKLLLEDTVKSINRIEVINKIEKELLTAREKIEELKKEDNELEPHKKRLELWEKAIHLHKYQERIDELEKVKSRGEKDLDSNRAKLPESKDELKIAADDEKRVFEELEELKSGKEEKLKIINEIRKKDTILKELEKQSSVMNSEMNNLIKDLDKEKDIKRTLNPDLDKKKEDLKKINKYLHLNNNNQRLVNEFYEVESLIKKYEECFSQKEAFNKERERLSSQLDIVLKEKEEMTGVFKKVEAEYKNLESEKEDLNKKVGKLLQGRDLKKIRKEQDNLRAGKEKILKGIELSKNLESEKELLDKLRKNLSDLEKALKASEKSVNKEIQKIENHEKIIAHLEKEILLLAKIKDLESERKRLEDGTPCPLCGSVEHPYSDSKPPVKTDEEKELTLEKARKNESVKRMDQEREKVFTARSSIVSANEKIRDKEIKIEEIFQESDAIISELKINRKKDRLESLLEVENEKVKKSEELIAEIENSENLLKENRLKFEENLKRYSTLEKDLSNSEINMENIKKNISRLDGESDIKIREIENLEKVITLSLLDFNTFTVSLDSCEKILEDLKNRLDNWNLNIRSKEAIEKSINTMETEVARCDSRMSVLLTARESKSIDLKKINDDFQSLYHERMEIFGSKDPDQEEKQLEKGINVKESKLKEINEKHVSLIRKVALIKEKIKDLQKNISLTEKDLEKSRDVFSEKLKTSGFISREEYIDHCVHEDQINGLKERIESVKKGITSVSSLIKDRMSALENEKKLLSTDKGIMDLNKEKDSLDENLSMINRRIGEITLKLKENTENRKSLKLKLEEIEKQRKEVKKWGDLHELIGSADGKKFRNFAQGLTFEIMVRLANKQLKNMTDRYLLVRDNENPLDLNVVDNYQAGEIRSSKNLSGGEGFLVSLSLALGLSGMASRNIRVDSLFLDEGFGTLDEESLETALETLASLNHSGKIIGIISHIQALKERIPVQINVEPQTGGKSILSGPGCMAVN